MVKIKNNIKSSPIKSSDVAIPLPEDAMKELRVKLPHGSIALLEKRTGFKRDYIQKILKGDSNINEGSERVIQAAEKIIREVQNATKAKREKILNELSVLAHEINESSFKRIKD